MEKTVTPTWRFIPYKEQSAYSNMAIDEVIIDSYKKNKQPTLRLYGWQPHALSIGYFQNPFQFLKVTECLAQNVPVVRRLTGGGCIPHGNGITYSLVFSEQDIDLPESVKASFQHLCSFLIAFYQRLGLSADYAANATPNGPLGTFTDLCFASAQHYDITIDAKKIGGNAQKRNKDVIFQHGFIPLERVNRFDPFFTQTSPEPIYTLSDFSGKFTVPQMLDAITDAFRDTFGIKLESSPLTNDERSLQEKLLAEKYKSLQWNLHRIDPLKQTHDPRPKTQDFELFRVMGHES